MRKLDRLYLRLTQYLHAHRGAENFPSYSQIQAYRQGQFSDCPLYLGAMQQMFLRAYRGSWKSCTVSNSAPSMVANTTKTVRVSHPGKDYIHSPLKALQHAHFFPFHSGTLISPQNVVFIWFAP